MGFLKEERAQGSVEMLILIAGAIVLVSIVGVLLKNAAAEAANNANIQAAEAATT